MNTKEFAAMLDGRQYRKEITREEEKLAKELGFVVAYGASDDLVEFAGAINDEIDANDGTTFYLTPKGLLQNKCNDSECPYFKKEQASAIAVEVLWCDSPEYSWTFEVPFPHETFDIREDDEKFCRGIVFRLADVKQGTL